MQKVVIASTNEGKLRELQALLSDTPYEFVLQSSFNIGNADETGLTFVENALIKARHACANTRLPAIADDSGLEVMALQGEPGIYSARYAQGRGDQANNEKLLRKVKDLPAHQRQARFVCVMVFMRHVLDPTPLIAQGMWYGEITLQPAGEHGFGYDPLFYLPDKQCTSAQLSAEEKNKLSHRAQAIVALKSAMTRM